MSIDIRQETDKQRLNSILNEVMFAEIEGREITPYQITKKRLVTSKIADTYEYIDYLVKELGSIRIEYRGNRKFLKVAHRGV